MSDRSKLITGVASGPVIYPARPRQEWFEQSVTQNYELGARYTTEDGRAFRYARAGAVALGTGEIMQSAVTGGSSATVQTDIAVQANTAIGETYLPVTLDTDAATLNQYAGGYLCISDGAGQGQMFRIRSNDVATAGGTCTLELDRPLLVAVTSAASKVQMMTDPYNLVIQAPVTTPTGFPLGICPIEVDINYYCWLQTWGMCCCLIKTALTMGTNVLLDVAAAGSLGVDDGALINSKLGITGIVTATTDSGFVFLTIAP
jgi:hypothetical protein